MSRRRGGAIESVGHRMRTFGLRWSSETLSQTSSETLSNWIIGVFFRSNAVWARGFEWIVALLGPLLKMQTRLDKVSD